MPDWKDTVNLPRTGFPMKANLQTAEPEALARWQAAGLEKKLEERRRGAPKFVLHDGPPYANDKIHLGTALNKILKDLVVKSKSMMGFDSPYVPGWDCHGLPIELRVEKNVGTKKKNENPVEFRRECRKYADKYLDIQRQGFKRLGILGEWDDPYTTMSYVYEATIARTYGDFFKSGNV